MTVDLDSGTGLFDKIGKLLYILKITNAFLGGTASDELPTEVEDALEKFDGESVLIRSAVSALPAAMVSFQSKTEMIATIRAAIQNAIVEVVDADDPLPQKTVVRAYQRLIDQMVAGSETVDANEPSIATVAGSGNTGNAVVVTTLTDGLGNVRELAIPEDLVISVSSNSTAGSEELSIEGERKLGADDLSYYFDTDGSGEDASSTVVDPASTNILTNGQFENFTSDAPDNWTIDTGAATTDLEDETSDFYRGAKALKIKGDGSTLVAISQDLLGLSALTPYAANLWTRKSGTVSAGTLVIDLYDGSSVINDEAGNANSMSIDLSAESTSYAAHNAVFRLPDPIPTTVKLRVRLTTAITSGGAILVDDLAMASMTELYTNGPFVRVFTGDTSLDLDDTWTVTVTNDFRGDFQTWLYRCLGLGLLPSNSAGSETIADSLIG